MVVSLYVNDHQNYLPHLRDEQFKTSKIMLSNDVQCMAFNNLLIKELYYFLDLKRKEIKLFHFSGHSNNKGIKMFSQLADGRNLASYLNDAKRFPNLECVFINGCANYEIINQLDNVKFVIGTNSNINDSTACTFSECFFENLVTGEHTYAEAFETSLRQVNLSIENSIEKRSEGASTDNEELNQWILFHDPEFDPRKTSLKFKNVDIRDNINEHFKSHFVNFFDKDLEAPQPNRKYYIEFPTIIATSLMKYLVRRPPQNLAGKNCRVFGKDRFAEQSKTFTLIFNLLKAIVLSISRKHITDLKKEFGNNFLDPLVSFSSLIVTPDMPKNLMGLCLMIYPKLKDSFEEEIIMNILRIGFDVPEEMTVTQVRGYENTLMDNLSTCFNKEDLQEGDYFDTEILFCDFINKSFFLSTYEIEIVNSIDYLNFQHYNAPKYKVHRVVYKTDSVNVKRKLKGELGPDNLIDDITGFLVSCVFLKKREEDSRLNLTPFLMNKNSFVESDDTLGDFFFFDFFDQKDQRIVYTKAASMNEEDNEIIKDEPMYWALREMFLDFILKLYPEMSMAS